VTGADDLFNELEDVERVRAVVRSFGPDLSTARLRAVTGGEVDLSVTPHRVALLAWLRAWGCRHLRVADSGRSSRSLATWWRRFGASMPDPSRALDDLTGAELDAAAAAFGRLASAPAAYRAAVTGPVAVTFGETAAAKGLYAIRPLAFPPWDAPMRTAFGFHGAEGYRAYLERVAAATHALARALGVPVAEVPGALGRPDASPPRLVDEYLWMRVNRPDATG
jgi:hypothetical protein